MSHCTLSTSNVKMLSDGGVTPSSHLVSTSGCQPGVLGIKEPPLPRVLHQGPEEEEGTMRIRGGTTDGARGGLREGAGGAASRECPETGVGVCARSQRWYKEVAGDGGV